MNKILFIDDDKNLLKGLKRGLHPQKKQWTMYFLDNPLQALEIVEKEQIDIVVTDYRMPHMTGFQLLSTLREKFPKVIRIVLTGQPDQETYAELISICHYFLWKPLEITALTSLLERLLKLDGILKNDHLTNTINALTSLPTLPDTYIRLTCMLNDPESDFKQLASIIKEDISLTMQTLKMVNSAFIGLVRQISSLDEALKFLGINTLRSLILAHRIYSLDPDMPQKTVEDINQLWQHSIMTARLAEGLVRQSKDPTLLAYTSIAGILHDVGRFIMMTNLHNEYQEIYTLIHQEKISTQQAEKQVLGVNHAELGAYLASLWGLPRTITEAIYFHQSKKIFPPVATFDICATIWHANRISLGLTAQSQEQLRILQSCHDLKHSLAFCGTR